MDFNTFLKKSKEQTVRSGLDKAAPDTGYFSELGAKVALGVQDTEPDKFTRETDRWVSDGGGRKSTARSLTAIQTDLDILSNRERALQREQSILLAPDALTDNSSRVEEIRKEIEELAQKRKTLETEKYVEEIYASKGKRDSFSGQFDANMELGRIVQDQGRAWNDYLENPTEANRKRAELYDQAVKAFQTRNYEALDDKGQVAPLLSKDLANYLPQLVDQTKSQAAGAIAGGLIGGIATGGTGVLQGIKVGSALASGKQMFEVTRGAAFKRLLDLGVDEALARDLAQDEGIVNGIIESGDTYLEWLTLGGTKAVTGVASKIAPDLLKKASTKAGKSALKKLTDKVPALVKALAGYLGNIPQEGLEEGWQEGVSLANDARALEGKDTGILGLAAGSAKAALDPENREQVWEAAKGGMKIAAMVGGAQVVTNQILASGSKPETKTTVDKQVDKVDNKPIQVSEAASETVKQVAQQEKITRTENPESNVLDTATTLIMERQGLSLEVAQTRAEIMQKLIAGKEVKPRDLNRIEPTNPKTKAIFTELSGVQFPKGVSGETLFNLYRSAPQVAKATQEARVAEAEQAVARAQEVVAQEEARAEVQTQSQKQAEVGPDGKPMLDYDTFAEMYRGRSNPNASDREVQMHYLNYRNGSRQTLLLDSGAEITRNQFVSAMKEQYQAKGKNYSDGALNTMFNQMLTLADQGQLGNYAADLERIAQAYKEEAQDERGAEESSGAQMRGADGSQSEKPSQVLDQPAQGRERGTLRPGNRPVQGSSEDLSQKGLTPQKKFALELRARNIPTVETDFGSGLKPVQVIPREYYTEDMLEIEKLADRVQCRLVFCMGHIETTAGFKAAGMHVIGQGLVIVQADTTGRPFQQNAYHELYHRYEDTDSSLMYRTLSGVMGVWGMTDMNALDTFLTQRYQPKYKSHYGLFADNPDKYYGEFLADLYGGVEDRARMGEIFQPLHEAAVKAVEEWQAERDAAQQNTENKNSGSGGDRVFSATTDLTWEEQLETMSDLEETSALYIEETPNILAEVGLGDLPLCMTRQHLRDVMHEKSESNAHWHGVPEDVIERLPELLSQPAMVLNSNTRRGDIVVLLNATDADGLPIVATIHPNGHATIDGERGPANFITSVYGRDNFSRSAGQPSKNNLLYLALAKRGILYWNEKRTKALFQRVGLQLPYTMEKVPSDTILKQHAGYVKDRIPQRQFSAAEDEYTDYGIPEITSWSQAFAYFDSFDVKSKWQISFDMPPGFGPEMDLCLLDSKGKWIETIASYPNTADGLQEFLSELPSFLENAADVANATSKNQEASKKLDELMAKVEEYFGEEDSEDYPLPSDEEWAEIEGSYDDIFDDAPDFDLMSDLQNEREGFTRTDTKAFKKWHHDDSGELTLADGRPKVFLRGTVNAGATKARDHKDANSLGTFFTDDEDIARFYSQGMSVSPDMQNTLMDFLTGKRQDIGQEWKPKYAKGWGPARDYVKSTFSFDGKGFRLTPVKNGKPVRAAEANGFRLETTMSSKEDREETGVYEHVGQLRELAYFPKTKNGLERFNREFGDIVRAEGMGIRAIGKFYLSAKKTLVVDAEGYSYKGIPNSLLPPVIRSDKATNVSHINGIVARAFDNGYDCVVVKDVDDVGDVQDQYIVKDSSQIKSVYNRGTWSESDPDYLFSAAEAPDFSDFLDRLEQDFGEGSADKMISAFENLDRSRQAAVKMAESVGAAQSGFDPYTHLLNEYGAQEPGEKPDKAVDVPLRTKPHNKVSLTPRTVMEAKATPEARISSIEEAVVDDKFSYVEGHNKIQVNRANAYIQKKGWADAVAEWQRDVRDGKVNADLVARGAVILNNAGNSGMDGERYISLMTDYTNLLRAAGQSTQAARILKNLSPTGRLYQIQAYTDRANERIRPDNSAHNIPVEQWMQRTGELLADRLRTAVGGTRKQALTTAQTILSDLNHFARESFPEAEKTPGRTEMDRIQDLFNNYDNYREAWEAAKDTIREQYADQPDALAAFENFLETDLAEAFLGRYFDHPEVRISPDLTQRFRDAKTDEERDVVIDEIIKDIARQIPATKMDKFTALRYLNMLGNLKTQGRNVLGNLFNLGLTKAKNQVATVLELGANAVGIKVERTKSFTKDKETYKAALADFEPMKEIVLSGGKYEDGKKFDQRIEDQRRIFNNKFLEGYRKATNWAMTQGDLVFSRAAYADALAGYLAAHNVTFETADTATLDAARNYAVRQAAEATFRDSNAFSDMISSVRFKNPDTWTKKGANLLGEGLLPFRKTPANILVRAVEYSPVGVLTTAAEAVYGKRKTGVVDGSKVIDSLAKNITGTGILVLGYVLADSGLLKGKGSDDEKEKEFDELTGHQDYSIELPNGLSLTLDWLAPSSIPLFLGAQMAETAAEEGLTFRTGLEALGAITDPMLQMSMLQGLDDALSNASTYGDDSALVRFTGNALWSFATQGLTNTMLGQLERSLKNERSTTYRDKNKDLPDGIQYLLGKTLEKTPFVDYGQIPYIDAWGRTEQNARTDVGNVVNQFLNPSYTSWVNESDMEDELRRLSKVDSAVLISRPKSYFNVDNERRDLTGEEYVEYATTRGQTAYNVTTDLTESKAYAGLTDKQKAEAVVKVYDFANQLAKATVTGYDASKWGAEPPEGAAVPDKWVVNAAADAAEYGIPVADFVTAYVVASDAESYKDKNGKTVDNSESLKKAVAIYDLGLSDAQTKKLMEDLGVNKTVRGWNEKLVRNKLAQMDKKYG